MKKCKECGQAVPYVFTPGDIIEHETTGLLGVVPEPLMVTRVMGRAPDYNGPFYLPVIQLTGGTAGSPTGHLTRWPRHNCRPVHGFFRVTERV